MPGLSGGRRGVVRTGGEVAVAAFALEEVWAADRKAAALPLAAVAFFGQMLAVAVCENTQKIRTSNKFLWSGLFFRTTALTIGEFLQHLPTNSPLFCLI